MKRWYVILLGSLSVYLFLSYGGIKGYSQAEVKKNTGQEKVLATVNGMPIYQKDIILDRSGRQTEAETSDYTQGMMKAIDQELLYQEAKRMKLDKEPEYQKQINLMKQYAKQYGNERLASFLESKKQAELENPNYVPPQEEIDKYYEANKDKFSNISKDYAKLQISQIIAKERSGPGGYQKWLKELFAKATIKINGKTIPKDTLTSSIESDILGTSRLSTPMAESSNTFFELVKSIIIEQAAKEKMVVESELEEDQAKVKELFLSTKISINDNTILLGDYPQAQNLFTLISQGRPLPPISYTVLFTIVKGELLLQEAKAEKLDQNAAFLSLPLPPQAALNQEKIMLIRRLEEKSGFYSESQESITDEEITQYYEENEGKFGNMGFESAKWRIRSILNYQKIEEKREKLLEKLRAKADIKIMK